MTKINNNLNNTDETDKMKIDDMETDYNQTSTIINKNTFQEPTRPIRRSKRNIPLKNYDQNKINYIASNQELVANFQNNLKKNEKHAKKRKSDTEQDSGNKKQKN